MSETSKQAEYKAMHERIVKAAIEYTKLDCIDLRRKSGDRDPDASYDRDYRAILTRHKITRDQLSAYSFDRVFELTNGKKCPCVECKTYRTQMRRHMSMER